MDRAAPSTEPEAEPRPDAKILEVLRHPDTIVLDLRTTHAFLGGHLPGSLHLSGRHLLSGGEGGDGKADRITRLAAGAPIHAEHRRIVVLVPSGGIASATERSGTLDVRLPDAWLPSAWATRVDHVVGPELLATWCRDGGTLHTIGEITPAELDDLVRIAGVITVDAGSEDPLLPFRSARPDTGGDSPELPVAVVGAEAPDRAMVAALVRACGIPDVLVLVDVPTSDVATPVDA